MIAIKPEEPVTSSNYDFKRHTLHPCLRAFVVLIITGFVIIFKAGPIRPSFAGFSFFLAFWILQYPFTLKKRRKIAVEQDSKTAPS